MTTQAHQLTHFTMGRFFLDAISILSALALMSACVAPVPAPQDSPPAPVISDKLAPELQALINADPQQSYDVIVQFYEEPSQAEQTQLESWIEITAYSFGPMNFAEGRIIGANVDEILGLPFVKWVEQQADNQPSGG